MPDTPKFAPSAEPQHQRPAPLVRNVLICAGLLFVVILLVYWYTL